MRKVLTKKSYFLCSQNIRPKLTLPNLTTLFRAKFSEPYADLRPLMVHAAWQLSLTQLILISISIYKKLNDICFNPGHPPPRPTSRWSSWRPRTRSSEILSSKWEIWRPTRKARIWGWQKIWRRSSTRFDALLSSFNIRLCLFLASYCLQLHCYGYFFSIQFFLIWESWL